MKAGEIRDLTVHDLREREKDLDDQLFRLRIQRAIGQVEGSHKVRALRKDLARVKTVIQEKLTAGDR